MNVKKEEKMERFKEIILPFEWENWNEVDQTTSEFFNVKFFDNFGEFKKDEEYCCLEVYYYNGVIHAKNEEGDTLIVQHFKCIPCDSDNNIS